MKHWHEVLHNKYDIIQKFNHGYSVRNSTPGFQKTLEIGAGIGEHLEYEKLEAEQQRDYVALDLRQNMADKIIERFPRVQTLVGDIQKGLNFDDGYFDRILAIHVLEHLPDLPAAIEEIYRLCDKEKGELSVVIPCEGGFSYSMARKISAQRIFEKRYNQSYKWFISREHINYPSEILEELKRKFIIKHQSFFPFHVPIITINLVIGYTLVPRTDL